jgi:hypothetical protein
VGAWGPGGRRGLGAYGLGGSLRSIFFGPIFRVFREIFVDIRTGIAYIIAGG